ncbi:hypothetical protein BC833DRAFT_647841 [Globomyces pollinis-pini]|nr:hypothetical protein BC833DRAFT_647841 [Globomyces pollinis-pini]
MTDINSFVNTWNNISQLQTYTEGNYNQTQSVYELMKSITIAQMDYGKSLKKIYKNYSSIIESKKEKNENVKQTFENECHTILLTDLDSIADHYIESSTSSLNQIKNSFAQLIQSDGTVKNLYASIYELKSKLEILSENVEKTHQVYLKEGRDTVELSNQKPLENPKIKMEYDRKCQMLNEATNHYKDAIFDHNLFKNKFYSEVLPDMLKTIQLNDHNRILQLKNLILKRHEAINSLQTTETVMWNHVSDNYDLLNPVTQHSQLILQLSTTEEYPADLIFDPLSDLVKENELKRENRKLAIEELKTIRNEISFNEFRREELDIIASKKKGVHLYEAITDTEMALNVLLVKRFILVVYLADSMGQTEQPVLYRGQTVLEVLKNIDPAFINQYPSKTITNDYLSKIRLEKNRKHLSLGNLLKLDKENSIIGNLFRSASNNSNSKLPKEDPKEAISVHSSPKNSTFFNIRNSYHKNKSPATSPSKSESSSASNSGSNLALSSRNVMSLSNIQEFSKQSEDDIETKLKVFKATEPSISLLDDSQLNHLMKTTPTENNEMNNNHDFIPRVLTKDPSVLVDGLKEDSKVDSDSMAKSSIRYPSFTGSFSSNK